MKRVLAMAAAIAVLGMLCCGTAGAADGKDQAFQSALATLDMYYDLDAEYMVVTMNNHFYTWQMGLQYDYEPFQVDAEAYETQLNLRFAVSASQLAQIRELADYDASAGTYTVSYVGGFGGDVPSRVYKGYTYNGDGIYTVYYQHVTYEYLPADAEIWDEIEKNNYPSQVEYDGKTYQSGPDGYSRIASYDNFGNAYHVEYNNGVVRILEKFSYWDQVSVVPDVTYEVNADAGITLAEGGFSKGTVVTADLASDAQRLQAAADAMAKIAEVYAVYEFTATLEGASVQPESPVTVTLRLPQTFGGNAVLYYMDDQGVLEKVQISQTDGGIQAQLSRFGTYILSDPDSKPTLVPEPSLTPEPSQSQPAESVPGETQTEPTQSQPADGDGGETDEDLLWLGIGAVAVLFLIAVALMLGSKK